MDNSKFSLFKMYIKDIFQYAGPQAYLSIVLMISLGLTQGASLFLLIPFLHVIGLGEQGDGGLLTHYISNILLWFGFPLTLPVILCLYVVIVAAFAVGTRWQEILNAKIVNGFIRSLRDRFYQAMAHVEWHAFTNVKPAEINHLLTGEAQRIGYGSQHLLQLVSTFFVMIVYLGVALAISAEITLLASASGTILLALLWPYHRKAQRAGVGLQQAMRDLYDAVTAHLAGMKLVKSYGMEEPHKKNAKAINLKVAEQFITFARLLADSMMYYQIGAAVILGLFFYGAVVIIGLPPAELLLMVVIFARILPKFSLLQKYTQNVSHTLSAYEAMLRMCHRFEAAQESPPPTIHPIRLTKNIELCKVSFWYHPQKGSRALHNINLVIPAGTMTAIVGPSGSGKSTLADILMGLLVPNEGVVLIEGQPLRGKHLHAWRRSVGYVPQETFLFHDTIRSNLLWGQTEINEDDLWNALAMASADEFVAQLPHGIDTVVGDRGLRISGGERQRITLARALLHRPSFLLLDEATSNLDKDNEQRIQRAIEKLHGELTIVIIAHRYSSIRGAEKIVTLKQGQIVNEEYQK